MHKVHELICIVCPVGCHLTVTETGEGEFSVVGNKCKRGETYGVKELTNPTRVLPTTVKIEGGILKRLPVKTKGAIPKDLIFEAMHVINKVSVKAPIKMGDVIIKDILHTGIDVVASRSMKEQ